MLQVISVHCRRESSKNDLNTRRAYLISKVMFVVVLRILLPDIIFLAKIITTTII